MKPDNQKATLMMRYLLGELSEDELLQFEAEYFADPTLFQEIRAARDELIDAYLRGELAPHERERFENFFMASPHRRERVEVARALITVVNGARQPPTTHARPLAITSWLKSLLSALTLRRWAFVAAVALLILLAGLWLVVKRGPTRQPLEVKQAPPLGQEPSPSNRKLEEAAASSPTPEAPRPEVAAPPPVMPQTSPAPFKPTVATIMLHPGLSRGSDETAALLISRDVNLAQLQVETEGPVFESYRAELLTPEGEKVWTKDKLRANRSGQTLILRLPAKLFKSADYILRLSGVSADNKLVEVGKYYFRVERK